MRENSFTKNMRNKSNIELAYIVENKSKYTPEALQAVMWELEDRNLIEKGEMNLPEIAESFSNQNSIQNEELKKENPFEEFEKPTLYSKKAVQGFTIFFSTIFGAVLLMHNLKRVNKPKERTQVLLFGILYVILSVVLLEILPKMFLITLLFNFIGYVILIEYFWNKYLGKDLEYVKKSISKPLIISFLISGFFLFIILFPSIVAA